MAGNNKLGFESVFEKVTDEMKKAQELMTKQFDTLFGKTTSESGNWDDNVKSLIKRMEEAQATQLENMKEFQSLFESRMQDMVELQQQLFENFFPKSLQVAPKKPKPKTPAKSATPTAAKKAPIKKASPQKKTTTTTKRTPAKKATTAAAKRPAAKKPAQRKRAASKPTAKKPAATTAKSGAAKSPAKPAASTSKSTTTGGNPKAPNAG